MEGSAIRAGFKKAHAYSYHHMHNGESSDRYSPSGSATFFIDSAICGHHIFEDIWPVQWLKNSYSVSVKDGIFTLNGLVGSECF